MMGRKLRAPNELLRMTRFTQMGPAAEYHRALVSGMTKATAAARVALAKEQRRRERYYAQGARSDVQIVSGDLVWVLRPPRGRGITKLTHQWVGPARVTSSAGFANWSVVRKDNDEHMIVHSSFMVSCRCSSDSLGSVADRILRELADEDAAAEESEMRSDEAIVAQNETDESTATESRQQEETGNLQRDGAGDE
ncbi:unnamed protein product [Phytophthora fragariaefolia]|uniref:Unnamed protein product n=1 Tax=Phytophthora fragariaefolia TaxID=1490495 RepID=A0A9W6XXU7_9STRA|nr:unnamed protein product [Phytophthora fragariaefolia]